MLLGSGHHRGPACCCGCCRYTLGHTQSTHQQHRSRLHTQVEVVRFQTDAESVAEVLCARAKDLNAVALVMARQATCRPRPAEADSMYLCRGMVVGRLYIMLMAC
jgi:hypothetical protein